MHLWRIAAATQSESDVVMPMYVCHFDACRSVNSLSAICCARCMSQSLLEVSQAGKSWQSLKSGLPHSSLLSHYTWYDCLDGVCCRQAAVVQQVSLRMAANCPAPQAPSFLSLCCSSLLLLSLCLSLSALPSLLSLLAFLLCLSTPFHGAHRPVRLPFAQLLLGPSVPLSRHHTFSHSGV